MALKDEYKNGRGNWVQNMVVSGQPCIYCLGKVFDTDVSEGNEATLKIGEDTYNFTAKKASGDIYDYFDYDIGEEVEYVFGYSDWEVVAD